MIDSPTISGESITSHHMKLSFSHSPFASSPVSTSAATVYELASISTFLAGGSAAPPSSSRARLPLDSASLGGSPELIRGLTLKEMLDQIHETKET